MKRIKRWKEKKKHEEKAESLAELRGGHQKHL